MEKRCTDIHWDHSGLIIIDVQNDFVLPEGGMPVAGAMEVVPKIRQVLNRARGCGMPIIHIVRYYKADGTNVDLCRREYIQSGAELVRPGSFGAEIVNGLKPGDAPEILMNAETLLAGEVQKIGSREWILYKPRWGAFYQTSLEEFLKEQQVDSLIFMGNNFPNCPRASIYEASERDFRIGLVVDAMSRLYEQGMEELKNIGVELLMAEDVIEKMKS